MMMNNYVILSGDNPFLVIFWTFVFMVAVFMCVAVWDACKRHELGRIPTIILTCLAVLFFPIALIAAICLGAAKENKRRKI